MMVNITLFTKILLLVSVGILSVLLLASIGIICWAGWKMNQHDEAIKKHSEETADLGKQTENLKTENEKSQNETEKLSRHVENLNEKSQNETENMNQKIQLIQKFNTFLINEHCNGSECLLCQTSWTFFNDSCYYFGNVRWTWDESRRYCWDKSADLIIINNLQELKLIYDNMKTFHWLGLYRSGNNWYWIDGRIDTLKFWRPSYPISDHDYAVMYRYANLTASWYSVSNTYARSPLCEQKAFKVSLN
uniref:C-type lectin domain-containing protein n=1 Tax=Poecilia formosa TaxID=48698 RepID=A0A096M0R5_POEFO